MAKRDQQKTSSSDDNAHKKQKKDSTAECRPDQTEKEQQKEKKQREEEEEGEYEEEIRDIPTLVESLIETFPLQLSCKDVRLTANTRKPVSNGYHFEGKYKRLIIQSTCISSTKTEMVDYAWSMSCLLVVCRNMGTFIGRFKATCKEANVRIPDFTTQSEFWFLIEPVYQYNTLSDYLKTLESNGLGMEPLYFIQMGITLYSMIFDAHSVDIGLYGITEESLRVGVDGSLYFVGFEYCMPLVQNNQIKPKPWMNPSHVEAPNFKVFRKNQYIKEADAFFASRLLDKIAQQNLSRKHSRFYKQVSTLLQSGLMVSHQKRATAQSLMESFERLRLNALNIKCEVIP